MIKCAEEIEKELEERGINADVVYGEEH